MSEGTHQTPPFSFDLQGDGLSRVPFSGNTSERHCSSEAFEKAHQNIHTQREIAPQLWMCTEKRHSHARWMPDGSPTCLCRSEFSNNLFVAAEVVYWGVESLAQSRQVGF